MSDVKTVIGHALHSTDSPYNFTMDGATGKLEIPDGVPKGHVVHYVERIYFADKTYEDRSREITV